MKYIAYDGRKFENLDCCEKYNSELKEKYDANSVDANSVDPIYLLSEEEYLHYKEGILAIPTWWWLRSPGIRFSSTASVYGDGSVSIIGCFVRNDDVAVRPALNLEHLEHLKSNAYTNGTFPYRFTWAGATWRTLEEDKIAIAEMPIFYSKFDDKSNDYESSFIRKKLLRWYNFRVSNHFVVQEVIGD